MYVRTCVSLSLDGASGDRLLIVVCVCACVCIQLLVYVMCVCDHIRHGMMCECASL